MRTAGRQAAAAAVAEPPSHATGPHSPLGVMRRTSEEVAVRHSDIPARLAEEMVVVVSSCPKRGINPDLADAHEAFHHVFEEHCQRCERRVNLRRSELQRAGVLEETHAYV